MVDFRPFKGWRPPVEFASRVACVPYDVLNTEEARAIIQSNSMSMMRVIRPDGEMEIGSSLHSEQAYQRALASFEDLIGLGLLVEDQVPHFYVYGQRMNDHWQVGLMGLGSTRDYENDLIKKHEFTRPDKEQDRVNHIEAVGAHLGPVFLSYRSHSNLDQIVEQIIEQTPDVDFVADDGVQHVLWPVSDENLLLEIQAQFKNVDAFYIADGHHRAAAAARVSGTQGDHGESASFLVVAFPDHALKILPYNRVVHHLNGHSRDEFLGLIDSIFDVQSLSSAQSPQGPKSLTMYLDGHWYGLTFKSHIETFEDDAVRSLDVSLLQHYVLEPLLGIADPRTDTGIEFVGGIRGLETLAQRADAQQGVAFAMYPTSMEQLLFVADSGSVMPPKSTWFEPKLRTGMVVNRFRK